MMRIFPIVTAALVCVALYFIVFDRDTLVGFASGSDAGSAVDEMATDAAPAQGASTGETGTQTGAAVHVVARRSTAQMSENAVTLRGRTEASREVAVSSEISGRIVSEPIRAGAFVEEGQLLCEINPGARPAALAEAEARQLEAEARLPEAQAQLPLARARQAEAEAALNAARIDANAASRLSESGFASETRAANAMATVSAAEAAVSAAAAGVSAAEAGVQAAQSGIRAAEAAVIRARSDMSNLTITAPFSGALETDTAELGSFMQVGSLCATIIQLDPLKLTGFVPEAQVDRVAVGAPARARLASGASVEGQVTFVSRSADDQTRTFEVSISVPNPDGSVRDGQTADILVASPGVSAHLLPASSMTLDDDGALGVRIVRDGIARFAPVTLLRDTVNGVLLAGLPDEADVITVGHEFVTDGVPVRVTYEELTQ